MEETGFREQLKRFYDTVPRRGADLEQRLAGFVSPQGLDEPDSDRSLPVSWTPAGLRRILDAFEGLEIRPDDIVILGDVACVQWTATGLHDARFLSYPATSRTVSFEGVDVVRRADGKFRRHVGWLDADRLHEALSPAPPPAPPAEPEGPAQRPVASRPVAQALLSAGDALRNVSTPTEGEEPFGWRAELDAPRWTLTEKKDWGWVPAVLVATLAALLGAGLLGLLWEEISDSRLQSETRSTALAVGGWAAVLVLAFVAWRSVSAWRSLARVQMDIRRTVPTRIEVHRTVTQGEAESGQAEQEVTTRTEQQPAETPPASTTTPTPGSVVQKEPVLLGSALVGGGSLALGLAGNLEGGEVAAVTAGALAISALFIREVVTPFVRERQDD